MPCIRPCFFFFLIFFFLLLLLLLILLLLFLFLLPFLYQPYLLYHPSPQLLLFSTAAVFCSFPVLLRIFILHRHFTLLRLRRLILLRLSSTTTPYAADVCFLNYFFSRHHHPLPTHCQLHCLLLCLYYVLGVHKISVLRQFSALLRYFFVIKIVDKALSLSKFWRHLANVKIVKIRHLNSRISYINKKKKKIEDNVAES